MEIRPDQKLPSLEEKNYHDAETLDKVRTVLEKYLEFKSDSDDIISDLHNEGILFRERSRSNNKGCTTKECHGTYAHSGPCCVNEKCSNRDKDI